MDRNDCFRLCVENTWYSSVWYPCHYTNGDDKLKAIPKPSAYHFFPLHYSSLCVLKGFPGRSHYVFNGLPIKHPGTPPLHVICNNLSFIVVDLLPIL